MAEGGKTKSGVEKVPGGTSFLKPCLIAAAAFLALLHAGFAIQARVDASRRLDATDSAVYHAADLAASALLGYASDVKAFARLDGVRALAAGDARSRAGVISTFAAFVREKPRTAQLRYLDAAGMERVRVDRIADRVVVVPDAELQDKADRYYFKDAIVLPPTAVYVSPVDLNVEHGEIEMPWNPMLRLARTIVGGDGRTEGLVIVNIRAEELLAGVEHGWHADEAPVQWLNAEGYWLAGAPQDDLWGFMFGRETTLAKRAPAVWAALDAADGTGRIRVDGVTYVARALDPTALLADRGTSHTGDRRWIFLGAVADASLAEIWTPPHLGIAAAGLAAIVAISIGWTGSIAARRRAEARERAAEAELATFERLASLGGLVAGVAHELNTPVGSAVTVASTIAERVKAFRVEMDTGPLRRASLDRFLGDMDHGAEIMLGGLERTARLVQQFKQVAVDQTSQQRRAFTVADLVRDVLGTLGPQFKQSQIRVVTEIASTARLDSYPGPLGQVLINLVNNARAHAFAADAAGTITVSARDLGANEIEIAVADDGRGMDEDVRARVFEPFFTTRLGQGGSGLGLSIVFNIVTGILGGSVAVDSAPGKGTRMTLRLPRVAPAEPQGSSGRIYDVHQ